MKYRLLYFDDRGRGEPIRLLFHMSGETFEDVRIAHEDWPEFRSKTPLGQLPVLECDGKQLIQTKAICRYLAKSFRLAGRNMADAAACDVVVDIVLDLYDQCEHVIMTESDQRKKNEHWREVYAACGKETLGRLDAILRRGTGYFVGNDITWADIVVFALVSNIKDNFKNMLQSHQQLLTFLSRMKDNSKIKSYYESIA
uniref:glutathione transferase n=1 Tax=Plectus sambesii TaxID=2011161 RepID=A0A914V039_9BILA